MLWAVELQDSMQGMPPEGDLLFIGSNSNLIELLCECVFWIIDLL